MARLAPAVQDAVAQAVMRLRPAAQDAAERIRQRPERVAARRRDSEAAAAREELLALRMQAFRRGQRWGTSSVDAGRETQWVAQTDAEEKRLRDGILALSDTDLRNALRRERVTQRWQERQRAANVKGPSMGM